MKPRLLALEGIGPYAGPVTVDFDRLADDGLFLIHGPTGAGKTFLLDAMSFALYGQVPGARAKDTLRSHHAGPETPSVCEFTFDAHGDRWKVCRTPTYERPKRRGAGTTTQHGTAHLFKREGGDWKEMATRTVEVDQQVRDLIGLDHEQFARVILLPQGQFEQVLRATSGEREALLTSLFDTELFGTIERWVEDAARASLATCRRADDRLAALRHQSVERWAEVGGVGAGPDGPADQGTLDQLAAAATAAAVDADLAAQRSTRLHADALRAHTSAVATAQRWDRRHTLREQLAALTSGAVAADSARVRLARAADARPVAGSVRAVDDAARRCDQLGRDATDALARVQAARSDCPVPLPDPAAGGRAVGGTAAESNPVDPADRSGITLLQQDVARLRGALAPLVDVAGRRDELGAEIELLQAGVRRADAAATGADDDARRAVTELVGVNERLALATAAAGRLEDLRGAVTQALTRTAAARQLQGAAVEAAAAETTHRAATEARLTATDARLRAWAGYLDGIAATLAGQLQDGEPCTVCGSADHPRPAVSADGSVRRDDVDRLEAAEAQAQNALEQATADLDGARLRVAELRGALGDDADTPADSLAQRAVDLEAQLAAATRSAADAATLAERVTELGATEARLRTRAAAQRELAAAQRARVEVLVAEQQACDGRLADALGTSDADPRAAVATLDLVDAAAAPAARLAAEADAARQLLVELRRRLAGDLAAAGFPDEPALRDALLSDADRERLAHLVERHDAELARVTALLGSDELRELPDARPDADAAAAGLAAAAATARDTAAAAATAVGTAARAIGGWAADHRRLADEVAPERERSALLCRVWDTVGGRVGDRISLRRWVLSAYLEDICGLASQRLTVMTSGRYTIRVRRTGSGGNRLGGLDLRVHDAHTAEERDVKTLSGGETFQASLALALAVADAVQHHCGGIALEALFIDEGFGSLDPDALELAMDELDALRAGGRMVGVISHVGAMRERIPSGIQVIPSDAGSRVRVGRIDA